MLRNLDFKKKLIIASSFFLATVLLFSLSVFAILGTPFDTHVLLNYVLVGVGVGLYVFILLHYKFIIALLLFVSGYIIAFVQMIYTFSNSAGGFSDLAGILLWMITIALVIALGIAVEIILSKRRKDRILKHYNIDSRDGEIIEADFEELE